MHRYLITLGLTFAVLTGSAQAQYVVYRPVVVAPAPVVSYYPAPVVSYYPPVMQTTYYTPSVSWYAPNVSYSAPVTTTVYSAPVYPVVATPGYVTARSYVGYGVFRPRGVYTSYYYNPGVSYYAGYMWP